MPVCDSSIDIGSQTFLSLPPKCTRDMLRSSPKFIGSPSGVSYSEYFSHSRVIAPSPPKKNDEIEIISKPVAYKISAVFDLTSEDEEQPTDERPKKVEQKRLHSRERRAKVEATSKNEVDESTAENSVPKSKQKQLFIKGRRINIEPHDKRETVENSKGCAIMNNKGKKLDTQEITKEFKAIDKMKLAENITGLQKEERIITVSNAELEPEIRKMTESRTGNILIKDKPKVLDANTEMEECDNISDEWIERLSESVYKMEEMGASAEEAEEHQAQLNTRIQDEDLHGLLSRMGIHNGSRKVIGARSESGRKKKRNGTKSARDSSKSVPLVTPSKVYRRNDFTNAMTSEGMFDELSSGDDVMNLDLQLFLNEEDTEYNSDESDGSSSSPDQSTDISASVSSIRQPTTPPATAAVSFDETRSDLLEISQDDVHRDDVSKMELLQTGRDNISQVSNEEERILETYSLHGSPEKTDSHDFSESGENISQKCDSLVSRSAGATIGDTESSEVHAQKKILQDEEELIRSVSNSSSESSSRMEVHSCKSRKLENLVEKLCQDMISEDAELRHDSGTLISYFESVGDLIRSLPLLELKRVSRKSVNKDDGSQKSDGSYNSSRVTSLDEFTTDSSK